ncbi:hypothetical protein [Tateyamaria sp.]|uniref:hypothetical protein n=1 Tax=Tateyamaria sp. TaxID=1929288 RepID=UPI00329F7512
MAALRSLGVAVLLMVWVWARGDRCVPLFLGRYYWNAVRQRIHSGVSSVGFDDGAAHLDIALWDVDLAGSGNGGCWPLAGEQVGSSIWFALVLIALGLVLFNRG